MWRFIIASKLGGSAPLIVAAAVSGLAGLIVTWLVAAVAGPVVFTEFAVFSALFLFMVGVLFGVEQEMARGVAAARRAAGATASPWRRMPRGDRRRRGGRPGGSRAARPVDARFVLSGVVPSRFLVAVPCFVVVAAVQASARRYGPVDRPRPAAHGRRRAAGSRSPAWRCGSVVAPPGAQGGRDHALPNTLFLAVAIGILQGRPPTGLSARRSACEHATSTGTPRARCSPGSVRPSSSPALSRGAHRLRQAAGAARAVARPSS